ncbi:MAG: hypothetical protein M0R51_09375 [Clostridia bacterium]|nr:hypothetical protein [Clostridia bacterium]
MVNIKEWLSCAAKMFVFTLAIVYIFDTNIFYAIFASVFASWAFDSVMEKANVNSTETR